MRSTTQEIGVWLEQKFNRREDGLVFDTCDLGSFEQIQDFIEAHDHSVKTPAIYYQAFIDENLEEFLSTLEEELRSKLGCDRSNSCQTMAEVIATAELRTVVIDRSYLYAWEMIDGLWKWLKEHQVSLILVCSEANIEDSEILKHPAISQWDRLVVGVDIPCSLTSGCLI